MDSDSTKKSKELHHMPLPVAKLVNFPRILQTLKTFLTSILKMGTFRHHYGNCRKVQVEKVWVFGGFTSSLQCWSCFLVQTHNKPFHFLQPDTHIKPTPKPPVSSAVSKETRTVPLSGEGHLKGDYPILERQLKWMKCSTPGTKIYNIHLYPPLPTQSLSSLENS